MRKLASFNFITLNGFFEVSPGDISWHQHGGEENQYAVDALKNEGVLVFGRVTYQMMASYWPTPMATQNDPAVAEGMNRAKKIVFSRTLKKADWANTKVVSGDIVDEMRRMKKAAGPDMVILGSGSIVAQFAEAGLIDEFQIMVDPVALGQGTPLFKNIGKKLDLTLTGTRAFKSGVVLLSYEPVP